MLLYYSLNRTVLWVCYLHYIDLFGITLNIPGTLVKEGGNPLTKVDLGVHCDKGHGAWSCFPSYQLIDRITEESLEGLERIWLEST